MPFGNSLMTATEGTHALTKGEVYVNTDALFLFFMEHPVYSGFPKSARKTLQIPVWHGGVTCISCTGDIVFLDKIAHVFDLWR